jgi:general stress protein 26
MNTEIKPEATAMHEHFLELLRKFHTGTLVTRGHDGQMRGRPMAVARAESDGVLWFLTDGTSQKVAELGIDEHALVSFADSDRFVVVDGVVQVIRAPDMVRSLWKEPFRVWFNGPDDPKLTLLRFSPTQGEYWNNAGAQGIKYAFRAAKAYIKGEKLRDIDDPAVHGTVHR